MSSLSTHVLDAVRGQPAAGMTVELYAASGPPEPIGAGVTDADGRVAALGATALQPGGYRLLFDTGGYVDRVGECFYPEVTISFTVSEERHYHVPLLLSPYAFSTYRGS